jgi:hypothetical protein
MMKPEKEHDEMNPMFHDSAIGEVDRSGNVIVSEFLAAYRLKARDGSDTGLGVH